MIRSAPSKLVNVQEIRHRNSRKLVITHMWTWRYNSTVESRDTNRQRGSEQQARHNN